MYAIGDWNWNTDKRHWQPPADARAVFDFRGPARASRRTHEGIGLFWFGGLVPSEYRPIAANPFEQLTAQNTAIFGSALGIHPPLQGGSLVDSVREVLLLHADPTGDMGPKPPMPGLFGDVEVWMRGARCWAQNIRSMTAIESRLIYDLIRRNWLDLKRRSAGTRDPDVHRRYLATLVAKTGKHHTEITGSNKPEDTPLEPHTSISDNFNTADSGTLGAQLTWGMGMMTVFDWDNVSNEAKDMYDDPASSKHVGAEAQSDLSTDDHYAETDGVTNSGTWGGAACRIAVDGESWYSGMGTTNTQSIYKNVSATPTNLFLGTDALSSPFKVAIAVDASTLKLYVNGTLEDTQTDTDLSGNVRCGLAAVAITGGGGTTINTFAAADGAYPVAGGSAPPPARILRLRHMLNR